MRAQPVSSCASCRLKLSLHVLVMVVAVLDEEAEVAEFAFGLAGELAAEQWSAVAVLDDPGGLLGERLFPAFVEGQHPQGEADREREDRRPPDARSGLLDEQPVGNHPD